MTKNNQSFLNDFYLLLLKPRKFLNERYQNLQDKRIFFLGFVGVLFGLVAGGLISLFLLKIAINDFSVNQTNYLETLKILNMSADDFLLKLKEQNSYSIVLIVLSPLIAYMAPHIFGGAVFFCFKLINFDKNKKLSLLTSTNCASLAMTAMFFYALPFIGPLIAPIIVCITMSKALSASGIHGFSKVMSILFALYITFFISALSLQALSVGIFSQLP